MFFMKENYSFFEQRDVGGGDLPLALSQNREGSLVSLIVLCKIGEDELLSLKQRKLLSFSIILVNLTMLSSLLLYSLKVNDVSNKDKMK